MYEELFRNLPSDKNWEGSFYETLTEHGIWDEIEFSKLEFCLCAINAQMESSKILDARIVRALLELQQRISRCIQSHYDRKDIFKISNVSEEQLYDLVERFELAFWSRAKVQEVFDA